MLKQHQYVILIQEIDIPNNPQSGMKGDIIMSGTNIKNFSKGLAFGMAVGAAAVLFADPLNDRQRHKLHKKTEGVFKNIGGMIDTAMDFMH